MTLEHYENLLCSCGDNSDPQIIDIICWDIVEDWEIMRRYRNGAWSRGRTGTPLRTRDFKSRVSTNSTTQALLFY